MKSMEAERMLRDFEARLGVSLPGGMHRFFGDPPVLQYLQPPELESIVELSDLYPSIPLRVIPVFSTVAGNLLCLYYPRDRGSSFVVGFDHEECVIFPLAADPDALFGDPDRFSHDHPNNDHTYPEKDWNACAHVLMSIDAPVPELELLKPLAFYARELERDDQQFFSRLLSRFTSDDPDARTVRESFSDVQHLADPVRWERLARRLPPGGAIRAYENALALSALRPAARSVDILEALLPIVEEHGDALDRATVPQHLRAARRLARGD